MKIEKYHIRCYQDGTKPAIALLINLCYEIYTFSLYAERETLRLCKKQLAQAEKRIRELIKAVYVEALYKSSDKRRQKIHIEYDPVGYIPVDELLKAEQV